MLFEDYMISSKYKQLYSPKCINSNQYKSITFDKNVMTLECLGSLQWVHCFMQLPLVTEAINKVSHELENTSVEYEYRLGIFEFHFQCGYLGFYLDIRH